MRSLQLAGSAFVCTFGLLLAPATSQSANVVINAQAGFDDSTPATPIGGNTGTTIGAQRLIAFQYAADLWGARLKSDVDIHVDARFSSLSCTASGGVLGAAGPNFVNRDTANLPLNNTWYATALADSLAGSDLVAGNPDIDAEFNANVGKTGCLSSLQWYYGLDGGAFGSQLDFVAILLHELGHGLGFLTLVNSQTGARFQSLDDAYMIHLEDHSTGLQWPQMSDAQRAASAIDGSQSSSGLHWTGASANTVAAALLSSGIGAGGHPEMYAPNPYEAGSSVSHFAKTLTPNALMEPAYTEPIDDLELSLALLEDTGWAIVGTCGDGVVESIEECDDNNLVDGDGCDSNCTFTACGNAIATSREGCDDGNTIDGDCCDSSCTPEPINAPCGDLDICLIGTCDGLGDCTNAAIVDCSDANPCTDDSCDITGACSSVVRPPALDCFAAAQSQIKLIDRDDGNGDRFQWKWKKGDPVAPNDLGDPTSASEYGLCLYDYVAGVASVAGSINITAGANWTLVAGPGYSYKDKALSSEGVQKAKVRTGAAGKSKAELKAKGMNLPLPLPAGAGQFFNADQRLVVQLVNDAGRCWESEFGVSDIQRNQLDRFQAKVR